MEAEKLVGEEAAKKIVADAKRQQEQLAQERQKKEDEAREAALEKEFEKDLPQIRQSLAAFITPGFAYRDKRAPKGLISLAWLEGIGALSDTHRHQHSSSGNINSHSPFSCNQTESAFRAMNSSTGRPSISWGRGTRFCLPLRKIVMNFAFRSRRTRRSAAFNLRFSFAMWLSNSRLMYGINAAVGDRYSSRYCGGDLPVLLMMRG